MVFLASSTVMNDITFGRVFAATALIFLLVGPAQALTLKSGEVLGSDGQVHTGASPENMEKMERRFRESGKQSLVLGEMLFLNVEGETVRFGLKELTSKSLAEVDALIDKRIDAAFERVVKRGAGEAARDAASDEAKSQVKDEAKDEAKDKAKDKAKAEAKEKAKQEAKQEAKQAAASEAKSAARAAAKSAASEAVREAVSDAKKAEKKGTKKAPASGS